MRRNSVLQLKLDKITIDEIYEIKRKLSEIQRLLNKGELEAAKDELERLVFQLDHVINQINNRDVRQQLVFAAYHLERAIFSALDAVLNDKNITSSSNV